MVDYQSKLYQEMGKRIKRELKNSGFPMTRDSGKEVFHG